MILQFDARQVIGDGHDGTLREVSGLARVCGTAFHRTYDKTESRLDGAVIRALDLATGGRGFNPSRCTVECVLGQVVHTHRPAPLKLRPYGTIKIMKKIK